MRYFLAISFFLAFVFSTNAFGRRFIAVENCTSSGKIATIRKCLINDNKFTLLITVNPLNANTTKTVIKFHLFITAGNTTRELFKIPPIPGCFVAEQRFRSNPVGLAILKLIKHFMKSQQKCPYVGPIDVIDFSLYEKPFLLMPKGMYRFTAHFTSNLDDFVFYLSLTFEIQND